MNNCASLTSSFAQSVVSENGERQSLIETNDSRNYLRIVKAIYPFKGANNDELCFEKDDLIILTQTPDGGWYEGTHLSKRITGWFPASYVTPLSMEQAHSLLDEQFIDSFYKDNNQQTNRMIALNELISNESNYFIELENILQTYLITLRKAQIFPDEDVKNVMKSLANVIDTHKKFHAALDNLKSEPGSAARIGGVFMSHAPAIKQVHLEYCALHPKFVFAIEQQKNKVCEQLKEALLTSSDTSEDQLLPLTTGLSLTFRHLDRYPSCLQEIQRHTNDAHPDRGDVQRAGFVFRELVTCCLQLRRQKEMELEVMLGNVKNWPASSEPIQNLGSVVHMGPVTILETPYSSESKKDRYLVLFPSCLVSLSVSDEMTSFVYEMKSSLTKVTLPRLPDIQSTKTTFQLLIVDPSTDTSGKYIFMCPNPEDVHQWISLMHKCKSKLETKNIESSSVEEATGSPAHLTQTESPTVSSLESNRNPYWATRSLLPHSPNRPGGPHSDGNSPSLSGSKNANLAVNDMAILKIIEAYCHGSRARGNEVPQILLAEDEKIISSKSDIDLEEKSLVDVVYELQEEVKQIKIDINYLSEVLRKERQTRKKLIHRIENHKNY